ncbi:hypothetical protein FS749_015298 [Ceratobasidium sp. UAMH 11750]|nr:hypothetical protein FS749_015298 [Ceratobasidium sp. UAMH 11750]
MSAGTKRSLEEDFNRVKKLFRGPSTQPAGSSATSAPNPQPAPLTLSSGLVLPTTTPPYPGSRSGTQNLLAAATLPALASTVGQSIKHESWDGLKMFAGVLGRGAAVFEPLKQLVDGIVMCVETFEGAAENREDYQRLRTELNALFHDLAGYFGASTPPVMTSSIINLAQGIERELRLVQEKRRQNGTGRYMNTTKDADEVLECYCRIQRLLERLALNANLSVWKTVDEQATETRLKNLPNSPAAKYRSAESASLRRGGCTPNTRIQVLEQLHGWARDGMGQKIYWLNGMAGTGKTTIAYSLCERLEHDQKLAASFFCSRQLPECRNVNRIVSTISYQLARFSHPFQCTISRILGEDPDAYNQSLLEQFKQLILSPLSEVKDALPTDLIVVIDALDECDDTGGVGRILEVLLAHARDLPIKFLVTSRPDAKILDRMRGHQGHIPVELRLHELERSTVQEDIKTYLRTELGSRMALTPDNLMTLVERSGVLFIYAATVVGYIGGDNFSRGAKRLREVLDVSGSSSRDSEEEIDALYTAILKAAFDDPSLRKSDRAEMKLILDTIMCAQEPLPLDVISGLLGLDGEASVQAALRPMLSVLQVSDTTHVATTLHESFPDYLLNKSRSDIFYCDAKEHNAHLTQLCFNQIIVLSPSFNICNLESSYLFDEDVPDLPNKVQEAISEELFYACRYWSAHLMLARGSQTLADTLFTFLSKRLLLWMEVMNLEECIHDGAGALRNMWEWSTSQSADWLNANTKVLLRDAWMFATAFSSSPAMRSTPHIYVSMLTFWPDGRPITRYYPHKRAHLVNRASTALHMRRTPPLATIDTWTPIRSMACSPDSACIVSSSNDPIICTWDARTGQTGQLPEGHTGVVYSVAFSPNGAYIVSCSDDKTIRVWDAHTGQMVGQPLEGHTDQVISVACSPDSTRIVSGSEDMTIRIWDAHTGQMIGQPLEGHTGHIKSVGYSPNGAYIVSGSNDETIRIWDARAGQMTGRPLHGDVGSFELVAYLPCGGYIVSGSPVAIHLWDAQTGRTLGRLSLPGQAGSHISFAYSPRSGYLVSGTSGGSIYIWNIRTGRMVGQPLQGHTKMVTSVACSLDGRFIFSGSYDATICIWDAQICQATRLPPQGHAGMGQSQEGHTGAVCSVAFSPDGAHTVSGSDDGTVCIWDARTGRIVGRPLGGHTDRVYSVGYSPNGAYIASCSEDKTLRIWDARTGQAIGQPLEGHTDAVYSVAFSPNGAYIISGSGDKTIRIWDAITGLVVGQQLEGHTDIVLSVGFSPDGAYIVSGSQDTTIRIWDAHAGQAIGQPLEGHTRGVSSVAFSPDSAHIISGSAD